MTIRKGNAVKGTQILKIHNLGTHTFNKNKSQCFLESLNSQTRKGNIL